MVFAWRNGAAITTEAFERAVSGLAARLPRKSHVVNLCEDRYAFTVAFAAALMAGQTTLLPPSRAPEAVRDSCEGFDAHTLTDEEVLGHSGSRMNFSVDNEHLAAIVFTSGSTGKPVPHAKTWGSLVAGAKALADRLKAAGTIVGTVPPQHMFGLEATVMLPWQNGLALHAGRPLLPADLGAALADEILARYARSEGPFLLGCPGGRSLRSTYHALAARRPELDRCVVVMMDEYVGAPADAHFSCTRFAHEEIARSLGVPRERVWLPDESDPAAYDERIDNAGGVDLFLLASGASDGHVAMLGPGAPRDGRTAVVELAETTRRDNLATFPEFRSLDEVPRHGVSVGLATIADARALRLVLHGEGKREATRRLLALDRFDPSWPASIVHEHPDARIYVDEAAAA